MRKPKSRRDFERLSFIERTSFTHGDSLRHANDACIPVSVRRPGSDSEAGTPAARFPARPMGEPERRVGVSLRSRRRRPQRTVVRQGDVRQEDRRSLLLGKQALGDSGPRQEEQDRLVSPHRSSPCRVARERCLAAVRRRRLRSHGLGERQGGRQARRRLHAVRHRHLQSRQTGRVGDHRRAGVRPYRSVPPHRQADRLVHHLQRHLADRLAGSTPEGVHRRLQGDDDE